MPSRAPTEAAAGGAAGTPSTRGTLTTAVTPVTVQRGSGAARIPFLAVKDVPPPSVSTIVVGTGFWTVDDEDECDIDDLYFDVAGPDSTV